MGSNADAVKEGEPAPEKASLSEDFVDTIGIHIVGKIPKQQAAIVAAITWVLGSLPAVLGALRAG